MKRCLGRLLVFGFLGVTANVALAWCVGALGDLGLANDGIEIGRVRSGEGWTDVLIHRRFGGIRVECVSRFLMCGNSTFRSDDLPELTASVPRWSHTRDPSSHGLGWNCDKLTEQAYGWPFLSSRCGIDTLHISLEVLRHDPGFEFLDNQPGDGVVGGILLAADSSQGLADIRVLAMRPIWPGFAANSFLFATTLWLVFSGPPRLRSAIRRRHGRCPTCGYPLLDRPHDGCPECGWNRPP